MLAFGLKYCSQNQLESSPVLAKRKKTKKEPRFEDLDLSKIMLAALKEARYEVPSPIQASMIPLAMDGCDVIGQARTGTGKTAAFAIPILEQLEPQRRSQGPQALILAPTRELAVQVRGEVAKLGYGRRLNCVAVYGGKPIRGQIEKLNQGAHIVVGTPGRVIDHVQRGTLKLDNLWCVVLDEADRMLDIGFRPDIEKILRKCPEDRQTFLLSATIPPPIERLSRKYMYEPEMVDLSPQGITVDTIEQRYFTVDPRKKFDLLVRLIQREEPAQMIVFCRTKRGTDKIQRRLAKKLDNVCCMHGDMQQSARDNVMERFRSGKFRFLVATDVVGRGIDVTSVSHIVNYDIPEYSDDYVHRVGRTGRMGKEGIAFTFVSPEEGTQLTRIEQGINKQLKRDSIEGFDPHAVYENDSKPPGEEPPPPPASSMRRPPKRYRRAL